MSEIQIVEHDEMRNAGHLPMNVDGGCSLLKGLETQVQSQSYASNQPQKNSEVEIDLSSIICYESDILQTRMNPGDHRDNIYSASGATDLEQIVPQFSQSNQGNLLYNLY